MNDRVFKMFTVTGNSKEEAFLKTPFIVLKECTRSYNEHINKFGMTEANELEFMHYYLHLNSKNKKDIGFFITVKRPKLNKRLKPYTIHNVNTKPNSEFRGRTPYKTVYQFFDMNTGNIIKQLNGSKRNSDGDITSRFCLSKKKAKEEIKKIYKEGFTGNIECRKVRIPVFENRNVVFTTEYTPTIDSQKGIYKIFGFISPNKL